jgi:hypothetical protein
MRADFGADLHQQVFEPMDAAFSTFISDIVSQAIELYETRINLDNVDVDVEALDGKIILTVSYTIISTNTRSNIVYPYYLNEGTNL